MDVRTAKKPQGRRVLLMDGVKSIDTPDAQTVVITMEAPNSEFLGVLTAPYTGIINSDVAIGNGANADADAATPTLPKPGSWPTPPAADPMCSAATSPTTSCASSRTRTTGARSRSSTRS